MNKVINHIDELDTDVLHMYLTQYFEEEGVRVSPDDFWMYEEREHITDRIKEYHNFTSVIQNINNIDNRKSTNKQISFNGGAYRHFLSYTIMDICKLLDRYKGQFDVL